LTRMMIFLILLFPLLACSSFITKSEESLLKERENNVYVLKKDMESENKKLKKGDVVKIIVSTGYTWIKVYAYPVKMDRLKADRFLLLYLFEDEFPEKKFIVDLFNERLGAAIGAKDDVGLSDKKIIRKQKK
jgi:type II secretion system-associated lipoprotein